MKSVVGDILASQMNKDKLSVYNGDKMTITRVSDPVVATLCTPADYIQL